MSLANSTLAQYGKQNAVKIIAVCLNKNSRDYKCFTTLNGILIKPILSQ